MKPPRRRVAAPWDESLGRRPPFPGKSRGFVEELRPIMRGIKLTLAYDGTDYAGWQAQADKPTVQEVVEKAILAVTGEPVRVLASGRTDAGVHALGQVVGFRTESAISVEALPRALNANLPYDVSVLKAEEVAPDFHATHHAVRKRYRYRIHNHPIRNVFHRRTSWHYPAPLDAAAMHAAAQCLQGTHDFSSFESSGSERHTSVRTIFEIGVVRGVDDDPDLIVLEVEADGFLYNMVRAIVGSLVRIGRGTHSAEWLAEVLEARDRRLAGQTAPPEGLFLVRVEY